MSPFSPQFDLSPGRYYAFNINSYHRAVYRPATVSPVRHTTSLSPMSTSPKRKSRSSASTSVFMSLIRVFKFKRKGKLSGQKLTPIPSRSDASLSPIRNHQAKQRLPKVRSVPSRVEAWNLYVPQITRRPRAASLGDSMEVDTVDEEAGPTQYLYYDTSENPFATPPCTPRSVTPLSPGIMLENDVETPASSPGSVKSRKRGAVELSRMKTLQLLGPEACTAISEQYGDVV